MATPCPPMNLVSECTTISAPCSIGRTRIGVATVLSTIRGTPWECARSAQRFDVANIAGGVPHRFTKDRARSFVDQRRDVLRRGRSKQSARGRRGDAAYGQATYASYHRAGEARRWCRRGRRESKKRRREQPVLTPRRARRRRLRVGRRAAPGCPSWGWRYGCSGTRDFQIKQRGALFRAVEFVADVLVDRRGDRFGRGSQVKPPCIEIVSLCMYPPSV